MAKYYITKYALGQKGQMIVVESDAQPDAQGYISLKWGGRMFADHFNMRRHVFTDEAAAKKQILIDRDKKIASLEKQITKLREIV